jgi:signal transduction histidine kinase
MANANSNQNRDGKTVYLRFVKALETCHTKYGDRATHAINGIMHRQFGEDMTAATLREIVRKGEFWKLAIQSQRAQHTRATQNQTAVEILDLLLDGVVATPTQGGVSKPYDYEADMPF